MQDFVHQQYPFIKEYSLNHNMKPYSTLIEGLFPFRQLFPPAFAVQSTRGFWVQAGKNQVRIGQARDLQD